MRFIVSPIGNLGGRVVVERLFRAAAGRSDRGAGRVVHRVDPCGSHRAVAGSLDFLTAVRKVDGRLSAASLDECRLADGGRIALIREIPLAKYAVPRRPVDFFAHAACIA
jgi:hypothetical protein